MPRAPYGNTWKIRQDLVDQAGLSNGKLTKDFETEEYRAGGGIHSRPVRGRSLHPNSTTYNATSLENDWKAGNVSRTPRRRGASTQQWG